MTIRSTVASGLKWMLGWVYPTQTRGASVLMYHSIGENPAFFTVRSDRFAEQMAELANSGKQVVMFSELVARRQRGESLANLVSITFDDGYLDTLEQALPILRRYGFRATIFVIPSRMGTTYTTSDGVTLPLFSWEEFQRAHADAVFEVLPHTLTHPELPRLGDELIAKEVGGSCEALERLTGRAVPKILSYPRGKHDNRVVRIVQSLEFEAACTVIPGLVQLTTDRFRMPRNPVDSQTSIARFRFFLSNGVYWFSRLW